jgi:acylphosphatase
MKKHFNITVRGKVQGVYFRRDTQLEAKRLGVFGTVANLEDGSVYIEAEAEELKLNEFVRWCHQGPELANVTEVNTEDAPLKGFKDFEVLAEPSDFLS